MVFCHYGNDGLNACVALLLVCGGILTGETGSVSYPTDSRQPYANGIDCFWRIRTTSTKVWLFTSTYISTGGGLGGRLNTVKNACFRASRKDNIQRVQKKRGQRTFLFLLLSSKRLNQIWLSMAYISDTFWQILCSKHDVIKMYYDRGRHIEQGRGGARRPDCRSSPARRRCCQSFCRIFGFGMTATRTAVSRTMSINFWTSWSRLALDHPFCVNSFVRRRELHDFSSGIVFITTLSTLEIFPL